MRKFFRFLQKNSENIIRVLIFIVSAAALLYIYPRESEFPFEFQKGKVWMHADYNAPFDFPVRKTDKEIQIEKDSILKEFKPYFNYQPNIQNEQLKKLNKSFKTMWSIYSDGRSGHKLSNEAVNFFKSADSTVQFHFKNFAVDLLSSVYQKGILPVTEQIEQNKGRDYSLVIIKNRVGEEYDISEVFTQKAAYEYIFDQVNNLANLSRNDRIVYESGFFKDLNLNEFILPNLEYNEAASQNVKNDLIKKISYTKGIFPADKKIIGHGEIVNDEKYNLLNSLKYEFENNKGSSLHFGLILTGQLIIICCLLSLLIIFLINFRREIYNNNLKYSFVLLLVVGVVGISCLVIKKDLINLYLIPFALLPIVIKTFYDARIALFVHTVAILLVGFVAPNGFEFVFLNFISGSVAIISVRSIYRRGKLFNSALIVIVTYYLLYLAINFIQGNGLDDLNWRMFIYFGVSGSLILMAYPLIFIFEKVFGFLSDITLLELSDTNQHLLRKLNEVAPGTFQHSLQVANLAEEAARKVGANPLLVRTGALYHDIGKMINPIFFIENQSSEHNPHDDISPEESAKIIIEHVTKGVEIARKNRLPEQITDFIKTHHGTTTARYFYNTYKLEHPENDVDKSKFTYPGPIPFSKETVLVMMADSVEAASRSLKEYSKQAINDLVDNIIYYQMINDQYNNSNITYREITTVKDLFKRKLMNIYHVRVEYPDGI